ncbi:tRNA (N6-isopentenyl adenosine(37)-C2)-methylthiotransferase MiaB [Lutispora thermophila]|uniref:tRNA-2-methylthio-N(6)-dimethylallyladenosine synthase n=1 Tax=Lutispora thermophila DSM 19022 TaxID=1122184 RepID=A0A1M6F8P6_9FIRM|nr:tRNA (N6-isopentenyl adenosine(37)-C2)-methylthiotransferase MiaB [Lutispora thermophila]SHI94124.1 tRNA-i(6)A37 thiotransferase enzyme MiaB [Lutispora thermophila DSM 19022]
MAKKEIVHVTVEEIAKQNEIILRIKENNDMEYNKTGRVKYAKVITYGCQQNNADSEKLKGMLKLMGYSQTEDNEEADVILFNTCCVRENAELKLYGNIGSLKGLKKKKPELIIGVCGCMMQQKHAVEMIKQKYKHVDLIFGTHNIYKFPEIFENALHEKYTLIDILDTDGVIVEKLPIERNEKHKAWITVMYGCNNFCSYCIVPYVRGRERSRDPKDIIEEIKNLAQDGCKEVTLLGQNVNSYGKDLPFNFDFADLLYEVNKINGIERIRFMTSHPKDISDKLITAMKDCSKVCEQLHLPFQAGSNKILKAMNRVYTIEEYLEKVDKVKKAIPGIALTTDIIVGFPGETTEDFQETLDVVRKVRFDQAFTFIYSKRKGTPAAKMEDNIKLEEKQRNFNKLVELQNQICKEINETYNGKIYEVLVDGPSKTNKDILTGRTRTGKIVNFRGNNVKIGDLVHVKIIEVHSWSLNGELVNDIRNQS